MDPSWVAGTDRRPTHDGSMPSPSASTPALAAAVSAGRATVDPDGSVHYRPGALGVDEARAEYDAIVAEAGEIAASTPRRSAVMRGQS
jgi:hypothetical protein